MRYLIISVNHCNYSNEAVLMTESEFKSLNISIEDLNKLTVKELKSRLKFSNKVAYNRICLLFKDEDCEFNIYLDKYSKVQRLTV